MYVQTNNVILAQTAHQKLSYMWRCVPDSLKKENWRAFETMIFVKHCLLLLILQNVIYEGISFFV